MRRQSHENRFLTQKHKTIQALPTRCFSVTKAVYNIYILLARTLHNTATNKTRALPSNPTYRHAVSITGNFVKKLVCGFLSGVEFPV